MLNTIKNHLKIRKALNLISDSYSAQIDLTVHCTLIAGTVYVNFQDISDELDSYEVQWLSPEAYDTLVSMDLIEPTNIYGVRGEI